MQIVCRPSLGINTASTDAGPFSAFLRLLCVSALSFFFSFSPNPNKYRTDPSRDKSDPRDKPALPVLPATPSTPPAISPAIPCFPIFPLLEYRLPRFFTSLLHCFIFPRYNSPEALHAQQSRRRATLHLRLGQKSRRYPRQRFLPGKRPGLRHAPSRAPRNARQISLLLQRLLHAQSNFQKRPLRMHDHLLGSRPVQPRSQSSRPKLLDVCPHRPPQSSKLPRRRPPLSKRPQRHLSPRADRYLRNEFRKPRLRKSSRTRPPSSQSRRI